MGGAKDRELLISFIFYQRTLPIMVVVSSVVYHIETKNFQASGRSEHEPLVVLVRLRS